MPVNLQVWTPGKPRAPLPPNTCLLRLRLDGVYNRVVLEAVDELGQRLDAGLVFSIRSDGVVRRHRELTEAANLQRDGVGRVLVQDT